MKSIILCEYKQNVDRVFGEENIAVLKQTAGCSGDIYGYEDVMANPEKFSDVEYIFSTWGMPSFTEQEVKMVFPQCKAVFYAAGTVQGFAKPFLTNGIKVFSAWAANAVPVAEYTVAQMILANKGFYRSAAAMSGGDVRKARAVFNAYNGNYGENIGIIGAGMIGKLVINMLKPYVLRVFVFDPFLSEEAAKELGVEKCSLEELFANCRVISNHLANNEQTKGMLNGKLFSSMLPNATFINTGRGAQVVEEDLIATLKERPDVIALLDVTYPEPPEPESELFSLDNCILTPHIAGSMGNETKRMAEYMIREFSHMAAGEPYQYEVTLKMLETMA